MTGSMLPGDDFVPYTSRFPLTPAGGRVPSNAEQPSGPLSRPFGLRFAQTAPHVIEAKHAKKPTRMTRTNATKLSGDGQTGDKYKPDVEHYVVMDQV